MEQNINTDFLEAMRKTTSTVTVIDSREGETQNAMTATSVVSFTLHTPSMLKCLDALSSPSLPSGSLAQSVLPVASEPRLRPPSAIKFIPFERTGESRHYKFY